MHLNTALPTIFVQVLRYSATSQGKKLFIRVAISSRNCLNMAPVRLDGTTLEGGGQLLRLSLGLSALSGIPIKIDRIRGNRSGGGGLKWQHLTSVNWLGHLSAADMEGAEHKSQTLLFKPSTKVSEQRHRMEQQS
jgi:hypothetical protein